MPAVPALRLGECAHEGQGVWSQDHSMPRYPAEPEAPTARHPGHDGQQAESEATIEDRPP